MRWPLTRRHTTEQTAAASDAERVEQEAARQRLLDLASQHAGRPERRYDNTRWTRMDRHR